MNFSSKSEISGEQLMAHISIGVTFFTTDWVRSPKNKEFTRLLAANAEKQGFRHFQTNWFISSERATNTSQMVHPEVPIKITFSPLDPDLIFLIYPVFGDAAKVYTLRRSDAFAYLIGASTMRALLEYIAFALCAEHRRLPFEIPPDR